MQDGLQETQFSSQRGKEGSEEVASEQTKQIPVY